MITIADRIAGVEEYYFSKKLREIAQLRSQGKDVINLGIGSPDLKPADSVIKALNNTSEQDNVHGYQSYKGIPALRGAFADWYKKYYQVDLNPETEILPLIGSKEGIMHISMTYLNPGDEVLVPNPGYPAYAAAANLTGASCRYYNLSDEQGWLPDLEALEGTDLNKVKLMWVNYPNMPTGTSASTALFEQLKAFGERNKILICNDNPYSFILNDEPLSMLSAGLSDYILELNSLSKSHNMAGWRVGMIAAKEQHINNILTFKSNMDSGMFLGIQAAAIEALKLGKDWYDSIDKIYKERRAVVWQIMDTLDCKYDKNQVGMFVWAKIPESIADVDVMINEILYQADVFITPGFIFGDQGKRYIRISLCAPVATFEKALKRIEQIKNK
ncbi:pyridoxal phosphate-dependent aminotransferase [Fulvivirga lutimaris]|uniref:pyridoxal phosphate-dependent aminotransferase n=1 Tax=Fulvivirga lutimaris TaxID=1819566 RepID=UPI0012BB593E|nr:aminotransferase class I/II-fold pyridoxal phosphate-dependent enzyme [Fulvivirga lutimaris]MTI39434.1 aminotransferase class I/II-fold pyridoxal phosphate-dependent enzyme [Fulvivirga lutimaris]